MERSSINGSTFDSSPIRLFKKVSISLLKAVSLTEISYFWSRLPTLIVLLKDRHFIINWRRWTFAALWPLQLLLRPIAITAGYLLLLLIFPPNFYMPICYGGCCLCPSDSSCRHGTRAPQCCCFVMAYTDALASAVDGRSYRHQLASPSDNWCFLGYFPLFLLFSLPP